MENFAFILHPLTAKDFCRKFSFAKGWSDSVIESIIRFIPPFKVSNIKGIKSPYARAEGWFIGCLLTSGQILCMPEEMVVRKIN